MLKFNCEMVTGDHIKVYSNTSDIIVVEVYAQDTEPGDYSLIGLTKIDAEALGEALLKWSTTVPDPLEP